MIDSEKKSYFLHTCTKTWSNLSNRSWKAMNHYKLIPSSCYTGRLLCKNGCCKYLGGFSLRYLRISELKEDKNNFSNQCKLF